MSMIIIGVANMPAPPTCRVSSEVSITRSIRDSRPAWIASKEVATTVHSCSMTSSTVRRAIFPVAGLATRFLPVTKAQSKYVLPLLDKPTIQYAVEEAIASELEQVIMVAGGAYSPIAEHFDRARELEFYLEDRGKRDLLAVLAEVDRLSDLVDITYIQQKEPLGLGHAIWLARRLVENEACAVLLPDDVILGGEPCLKQLMRAYAETRATVLAVRRV